MTFNRIPKNRRNRSYSDRLMSNPEEEEVLLLIMDTLGHYRRQDYADSYGGVGWGRSRFTTKDCVARLKPFVGDVYAKSIIGDNDAQNSLAKRTLKENRKQWHRDVEAGEKSKASRSAKRRANRAQKNLYVRTEPTVCFGGRNLWRSAQTDPESMVEFKFRRMWLGAVGRSDYIPTEGKRQKFHSNTNIRVVDDGSVMVSVPFILREELGASRSNPWVKVGEVHFHHGQDVIDQAKADGRSITYHIQRVAGHWKVRAQTSLPEVERSSASKRILGVDVNAGHIDAWVVDEFGNPVGSPITIAVKKRGMANSVNILLAWAAQRGVTAVALEDTRGLQRNSTRGGKRGALNRTISQIPTGQLKELVRTACEDRGWEFELVNPAYTSKNADSWADVAHRSEDRHQRASYLIGRRGLGFTIHRDRTQRMRAHSGGSEPVDLDVEFSEANWPLTSIPRKRPDTELIF